MFRKYSIFFLLPLLFSIAASQYNNTSWNYLKQGTDWNLTCSTGLSQSPINVVIAPSCQKLLTFSFSLFEVSGNVGFINESLAFTSNSSSNTFGSLTILDVNSQQQAYDATAVIFKAQAEHLFNGTQYDLEMQVKFERDAFSPGSTARNLAYMSFFFAGGADDLDLQYLFDSLNSNSSSVTWDLSTLSDIVNAAPNFYAYQGSLTYPNCSEVVNWYLYNKVFSLNYLQLKGFRALFNNPAYFSQSTYNTRAVQTLGNRTVEYLCASPITGQIIYQGNIFLVIGFWWMVGGAVFFGLSFLIFCNTHHRRKKPRGESGFYCHPVISILLISTPCFKRLDRLILVFLTFFTMSTFSAIFVRFLGITQNVDDWLYGLYCALITYVFSYVYGTAWKVFNFTCCNDTYLSVSVKEHEEQKIVVKFPFFFYAFALIVWAIESALLVWNTLFIPIANYTDFATTIGVAVFIDVLVISSLETLTSLLAPALKPLYAFRGYCYLTSYERNERIVRDLSEIKISPRKEKPAQNPYLVKVDTRTMEPEPVKSLVMGRSVSGGVSQLEIMNTQN